LKLELELRWKIGRKIERIAWELEELVRNIGARD